ncbi:hypothetical protein QE152_g26776 [Popillia japonica]|uniref:Uncharacterized protein n=1 Tax=Popillia japonica TaxID=7064 RepID=A0AAW1JWT8_POPJA
MADWNAFIDTIQITTEETTSTTYQECSKLIKQAYTNSKRRDSSMISIAYCRSNEIAKKREECNSARRRLTRAGKRPGINYCRSNEIAKKREECNSARRRLTRAGKRPGINMEGRMDPKKTYKLKKKRT